MRGQQRERLADRPRVDLEIGRAAHRLGVGLHPAAVERRRASASGGAGARRRRAAAPSARRRSARASRWPRRRGAARRALEQLLDQRRVEHHHELAVEQRAERDRVAVPAAAGVDEPGEQPNMKPAVWTIRGSRGPGGMRGSSAACVGAGARCGEAWPSLLRSGYCGACDAAALPLEVGERQLVRRRAIEAGVTRDAQVGVDVQQLAAASSRQPGSSSIRSVATTTAGRSARSPGADPDRAAGAGVVEVAARRSARRRRARARTARARPGSAAPTARRR